MSTKDPDDRKTSVTISLPIGILAKLDVIAHEDECNRSRKIVELVDAESERRAKAMKRGPK